MFTPGRQMSPFDVNMAADAGYQMVVPYCEVGARRHRRPDAGHHLLARARRAWRAPASSSAGATRCSPPTCWSARRRRWFKPFVVSLMADPSGAYTTAAAMVALRRGGAAARHAPGPRRRGACWCSAAPGRWAASPACWRRRRRGGLSVEPQRHATSPKSAQRHRASASASSCRRVGGDRAALRALARRRPMCVLACAAPGVQVLAADDLASRARAQGGGRRERGAARGHRRRRRDGRRQAAGRHRRGGHRRAGDRQRQVPDAAPAAGADARSREGGHARLRRSAAPPPATVAAESAAKPA